METIHQDVHIAVTNQIDPAIDIIKANTSLDDIRESIALFRVIKKIPIDRVKSEGRSGFYKIAKILIFELLTNCDLNFRFMSDHTFQVSFSVPTKTILA